MSKSTECIHFGRLSFIILEIEAQFLVFVYQQQLHRLGKCGMRSPAAYSTMAFCVCKIAIQSMVSLFIGRAVHGRCCRQNSWRVFKNRTASLARVEMCSVPMSARFKFGCFSKFSRYSLSTYNSPSSFRASRFSMLLMIPVLGRCFWFLLTFTIVAALAVCLGATIGLDWSVRILSDTNEPPAIGFFVVDAHFSNPPIVFSIASCVFWTPRRKLVSSGRKRRPRWKNIRLSSNRPRK